MSDAERLYRTIYRNMSELFPEMLEENVITVALMITGLLRARSGQLTKIASKVRYAGQKSSLVDRFRRLVRNENIIVAAEYNPVAQLFLSSLSHERLVLAIDSTQMGGNCICLMLSVQYKSRALPLVWVVFKGKKGHSSQALQRELFEAAKAYVPENCQVVLLGDGEFDGSQIVEWLEAQPTWDYVCRTDETNLVFYQGTWVALRDIPLEPGEETLIPQVHFTKSNQVGPINILAVWHESEQRHWFFVTSFDDYKTAQKWYRKRFGIETLFSDFKGRGFNLDETRLWIPARVSRLIFAASIAYVFTIFLGVESIVSGIYQQLVRSDDYYHSLFQLGLIYLDHLLNECLHIPLLSNLRSPASFAHGFT
jgi:hypothetical protein